MLGRQVGCGHDPLQLPGGAASGSLRGATPLHVLLAHCDWAAWPASCRAALQHRAKQLPHAELAGVHALALQPTAETVALASQLLACGARADAVLPSSGQSALHLLAAGGSYKWDGAKGSIVRRRRTMVHDGRVTYRVFADLLQRHWANLRQRDANGNACAHLACDAGNVAMVELCIEQLGLRLFEKPFCNQKGRTAASLAAEGGTVHEILHRHAGERRKLHEEAEERQRQAG